MAWLKRDGAAIEAIAVAAQIEDFDLLTEDLEAEYEGAWAGFGFDSSLDAIRKASPDETEVVVVCVSREDEDILDQPISVVKAAKEQGIKVLLIVDEISPKSMHTLMREGADDFTPYPLPEGVFGDTMRELRGKVSNDTAGPRDKRAPGVLLPVYSVGGGVGGTTFAVNLAWEMAVHLRKTEKKVAIIDLNLQYGSVASYLDLARRDAVFELYSNPASLEKESVMQAMQHYKKRLSVMSAPPDALPLDFLAADDVEKLLVTAKEAFDFTIVDLPPQLANWSSNVLTMAETYFAVLELDMRCADNMLRFLRALKSEDLPFEKIQYALNRAPAFGDLSGKRARMKRMAETLGIEFNMLLPDGGKAVGSAGDHGIPLAEAAANNALRKEMKKIAGSLIKIMETQATATL
ncbi:MAG: AAA family ATPase [Pseudomonadota bacterium]